MKAMWNRITPKRAYVLDPLDLLGQGDERNRLNPLALLNPESSTYDWLLRVLAEALIPAAQSPRDGFFVDSSRVIVAGIIDTVVRWKEIPPHEKTLASVREVVRIGVPTKMMSSMGGAAACAAALNERMRERLSNDLMASLIDRTRWLGFPPFAWVLSGCDFDLRGFRKVRLILPLNQSDAFTSFEQFLSAVLAASGQGALVLKRIAETQEAAE